MDFTLPQNEVLLPCLFSILYRACVGQGVGWWGGVVGWGGLVGSYLSCSTGPK